MLGKHLSAYLKLLEVGSAKGSETRSENHFHRGFEKCGALAGENGLSSWRRCEGIDSPSQSRQCVCWCDTTGMGFRRWCHGQFRATIAFERLLCAVVSLLWNNEDARDVILCPLPSFQWLKRPVGVGREGWDLNISHRAEAGSVQGIELQASS